MGWLELFDQLDKAMIFLLITVGVPAVLYAQKQIASTTPGQYQLTVGMTALIVLLYFLGTTSHIGIFLLCWALMPALVAMLIATFPTARALVPAQRAAWVLIKGSLLLAIGATLLQGPAHYNTFTEVTTQPISSRVEIGLLFIIVACAIQSALIPFQRWLMNSLAAPTAVSALMHAGVINAGGFLLLRLAPLLDQSLIAQLLLLSLGFLSVASGSLMSLMQAEQKRALACSTIGQMGFLFVEAGLGLHALLAAHLVAHGMYKAYSFLGMGFVLKEPQHRDKLPAALSIGRGILAGVLVLWLAHLWQEIDQAWDSSVVVDALIFYLGFQIGCSPLSSLASLFTSVGCGMSFALWHGFFETALPSSPQPWAIQHTVLIGCFIALLALRKLPLSWERRLYAQLLLWSQPSAEAVQLRRSSSWQGT